MKKERDVAKLKRWCMRRHGEGVTADEICNTAQIPRSTFYDWLRRYREHGLEGFEPKSRRPHTIHRTPPEIVDEIKALRATTAWGPQKIAGYLRTQHRPVGHMTATHGTKLFNLSRSLFRRFPRCPGITHAFVLLTRQSCQLDSTRSADLNLHLRRETGVKGHE
jgi:hypothetical protein